MSARKIVYSVIGLVVVGLILGVVVGNLFVNHDNPPVTYTIEWDSPQTEALARKACFDCHSHETVWPWYSYIAPPALLIAHDVDEGRKKMNFSTGHELEARELVREIRRGEMPLPIYLTLHPEANLSEADKTALIAGFEATFGN